MTLSNVHFKSLWCFLQWTVIGIMVVKIVKWAPLELGSQWFNARNMNVSIMNGISILSCNKTHSTESTPKIHLGLLQNQGNYKNAGLLRMTIFDPAYCFAILQEGQQNSFCCGRHFLPCMYLRQVKLSMFPTTFTWCGNLQTLDVLPVVWLTLICCLTTMQGYSVKTGFLAASKDSVGNMDILPDT